MDEYCLEVYRTAFSEIEKALANAQRPAYMKLRDIERIIRIVKEYQTQNDPCQRGVGPTR